MPKLKQDHRAVVEPGQLGKQIADLHFELELLTIAEFRPVALVAQSRDPNHVHSRIENWLTITNRHILNPTELVHPHQVDQGSLPRAKILSHQRHPRAGDRL